MGKDGAEIVPKTKAAFYGGEIRLIKRLCVEPSNRSLGFRTYCELLWRAAGQSLPENRNRSTHSWESKRAPNYRRFS